MSHVLISWRPPQRKNSSPRGMIQPANERPLGGDDTAGPLRDHSGGDTAGPMRDHSGGDGPLGGSQTPGKEFPLRGWDNRANERPLVGGGFLWQYIRLLFLFL